MVSITRLAEMVIDISGKRLDIVNIAGPTGVRGRRSDNRLIKQELGWRPSERLIKGLERTYAWIEQQVQAGQIRPKGIKAPPPPKAVRRTNGVAHGERNHAGA